MMYNPKLEKDTMKTFKPLILLVIPLLLTGCVQDKSNNVQKGKVTVNMEGIIPTAKVGGYNVTVDFNMSDFDSSATVYSNNIMMLSFAASIAAESNKAADFYKTMAFNDAYHSYPDPTINTIGYSLAHKKIKNADLVSVAIRGFDYGAEWANNLTIGSTGNHTGFDDRANEIYSVLNMYLTTHQYKNVKLWLSGYSRGGAVANLLASKLLSERNEIEIEKENLFVYTFESPRGLSKENAVEYENVFNIINDYDVVAKIAPVEYGLYRCGKDILISTDKDVDALLTAFDPNITLPQFTPLEDMYADEVEFIQFVLNQLMSSTYPEDASLTTREEFSTRYEATIAYIIKMYMTLPMMTINKIIDRASQLGIAEALAIIGEDDGIYNFLKPILDEDHITYVDAELKAHCYKVGYLVRAKFAMILFILNDGFMNNAKRMIYMHSPETIYALIK